MRHKTYNITESADPWQTHHNEGRVEWPPSQWRLLRSLVAVAGRGLTSLPFPDEGPPPKPEPKAKVEGLSSLKKRGVPKDAQKKLAVVKEGMLTLKESLSDTEADAWKAANPGESFATAIDRVRELASAPKKRALENTDGDEIPLSRLANLLAELVATPDIWVPKTAGGHTRQYLPIHEGKAPDKPEDLTTRIVKNSGSAVFDTFATVRKDQPLVFHWPDVELGPQSLADLRLLLSRLTYFGRAESWCRAEAHAMRVKELPEVVIEGAGRTHWCRVCIEDGRTPNGKEYRDYALERRLAPCKDGELQSEVLVLFPRTKTIAADSRLPDAAFREVLKNEGMGHSLLRCLLRESGHDIKDGLERPIGTRWVHYAVPREIYEVPRTVPQVRPRSYNPVDLVVYALNTASSHKAVLPPLTDTLLVADRFRSAAMALCPSPSPYLSGHDSVGQPLKDHQHVFWWPLDEDNDGFIDHVVAFAPGSLQPTDAEALRRLNRIRQRGGRPDLLVTPVFVGTSSGYTAWNAQLSKTFVSATPYFCPLHLSHGRTGGGRIRALVPLICESLRRQQLISRQEQVESIRELVFDYDPDILPAAHIQGAGGDPSPPRQFFPVVHPPTVPAPLPEPFEGFPPAYPAQKGVCQKDLDRPHTLGLAVGLYVNEGSRFIRALAFCRNRRGQEVKGHGRMLAITFRESRAARPFALGSQCHFGLGLFVPTKL